MAKKAATPRKRPPAGDPYINATLAVSDTVPRYMSYNPTDHAMVRRCCAQSLAIAVALNAGVCAQQPLRLYRRVGTQTGKGIWRGSRVKSRRTLGYLKGHGRVNAGRKTAMMLAEEDGVEEVLNHPALTLVRQPDPWQTGSDFMLLAMWFLEATGKCFLQKGERTMSGGPASLFHLFPQYTTVQGDRANMIGGYRYGRNTAGQVTYAADEVMFHRRMPSVLTPYLDAQSWPQSLQLEGDMENAALQAEVARWNNGGFPGIVVEVDPTKINMADPAKRKQLEQSIADQVRGVAKNGGVLVLSGAKPAQIGQKANEMGYKDGLEVLHRKILWGAGIPSSMADMSSSNLANAYRADPQYMGETINPRISKFAEELTEYLLVQSYGLTDYVFAFDCPVAEDRAALIEESVKLVTAGIIEPDEARQQLGYGADEEGEDEVEAPPLPEPARPNLTELTALLEAVKTEAIDAQAAKEALTVAYPSIPQDEVGRLIDAVEVTGPPEVQTPPTSPDGGGGDGVPGAGGVGTSDNAGGDKPIGGGDGGTKELDRLVTEMEGGFTLDLHDHAREVVEKDAHKPHHNPDTSVEGLQARLQAWYVVAMSDGVTDHGTINLTPHIPQLDAILADAIPKIAAESAAKAAQAIDAPPFVLTAHPRAVEAAKRSAAESVTQISETLREKLRDRVAEGVAESQTLPEIRQAIKDEAPTFSEERATLIAKTEHAKATSTGELAAWKENGIKQKDFLLNDTACPKCTALKAKYPEPIDLDSAYIFEGKPYMSPPFHPGCFCTNMPVMPKDPAPAPDQEAP